MLLSLTLINFIIVKEINIDFNTGFTVFTGETGAGKSIILDAISILLGEKAKTSQIKKGEDISKISALFEISNLVYLKNYLIDQNLLNNDYQNELILRRVIDINGKNKNFINGNLVTLNQLKQVGKYLVDIHGQYNHFSLNLESNQRNILDLYSDSLNISQEVKKIFLEWQYNKNKLSNTILNNENLKNTYDKLLLQKKELEFINLKNNEWEEISKKYNRLSKASEIISVADKIQNYIDNNSIQIFKLNKELISLSELEPLFTNSIDILNSIEAEFIEISSNMRNILNKVEINHQELEFIENRIKEILSLSKKYNIIPEEIKIKQQEIEQKINNLNSQLNIGKLQQEVNNLEKKYFQKSKQLTDLRIKGANNLAENITNVIKQLALNNAIFKIDLINTKPSLHGNENISFKIAINKGDDFQSITKIVSGGELSRISLAIEVIISDYTNIPTILFDEIDAGIGGKTAIIVANYLKKLSQQLQVIVVTHLPQIAAKGDHHFLVEKNDDQKNTITYVKKLDYNQRIEEISRMLGANEVTPSIRLHIKNLLVTTKQ